MKKYEFEIYCKEYGANPIAVKEIMKQEGLKRKEITRKRLLELIYINCTDLLYCRNAGDGTVEYAEYEQAKKVLIDMKEGRGA